MSYRILVTERARRDLQQACRWWVHNRSTEQAEEWFAGLLRAVYSAGENPQRFPLAQESRVLSRELRQINYGLAKQPTHRAVFVVEPDVVLVLRVRHLAWKWFAIDGV